MTDNPLILRQQVKPTWDLDAYCIRLNASNFVRSSGQPYFIAQRSNDDGTITRFLTR